MRVCPLALLALVACTSSSPPPVTPTCESGRLDGDLLTNSVVATRSYTGLIMPNRLPVFRAGDLDGDGRPELLVNTDHGAAVLERDEAAGLYSERPGPAPVDVSDADGLAVTDLDGDGKDDVAMVSLAGGLYGAVSSGGSGGYSSWRATTLEAFDYDGDGRDELALAEVDTLSFLAFEEFEWHVRGRAPLHAPALSFLSGDWNGDGQRDLAAHVEGPPHVGVLLGERSGRARLVPAFELTVSDLIGLASLRGPTSDRLVVAHRLAGDGLVIQLWGPAPDAPLALAHISTTTLTVSGVASIAAGDLDGDGTDELLVSAASTFVLTVSDGAHLTATGSIAGALVPTTAPLDVDGDGRDDVVLAEGPSLTIPYRFTVKRMTGALPAPVCTFASQPGTRVLGSSAGDVTVHPGESIQAALSAVRRGGRVQLEPGTYRENIVITGPLTLVGTGGPQVTILEPAADGSIVRIGGPEFRWVDVRIEGLTLRGARGMDGDRPSAAAIRADPTMGSTVELIGNVVTGNDTDAVQLFAPRTRAVLSANSIVHNGHDPHGVGVLAYENVDLTLINNVIADNGRGLELVGGRVTAMNNTVALNTLPIYLSPPVASPRRFVFRNTIIHERAEPPQLQNAGGLDLANNLFEPALVGATDHQGQTGDPRFMDAAAWDLRLRTDSPAVDRGTAVGAPVLDHEGRTRPQGAGVDVGAFESH